MVAGSCISNPDHRSDPKRDPGDHVLTQCPLRPQLAKAQGDFLLVGLHSDEDITERRGTHLPLMDLHERSLSVLACSCVDEVVIGARNTPHSQTTVWRVLAWDLLMWSASRLSALSYAASLPL